MKYEVFFHGSVFLEAEEGEDIVQKAIENLDESYCEVREIDEED